MKIINNFTSLMVAFFMMTGVIAVFSAEAAAAEFSEEADTVLELIDNEEELQDFLADMTPEERVEVVSELAAELRGDEAVRVFSSVFKVLIFIQPNNGMNALTAALQASDVDEKVAQGAIQGMIAGTIAHPELDSEEERLAALDRTANTAGKVVIQTAESMDKNPATAGYAVVRGAMAGIERGDEAQGRARTVAEAMARGGVGAASEPNKPGVSRAMMLALARVKDPDMRRGAVAGVAAGGEAEGGAAAVRLMEPLRNQLGRIIPVGPGPTTPEVSVAPDPDEVSPF